MDCGYKYLHTDKCPAAKGCGESGHFIKIFRSLKTVSKLNNVQSHALNETSFSDDSHIEKIFMIYIYKIVTLIRKTGKNKG